MNQTFTLIYRKAAEALARGEKPTDFGTLTPFVPQAFQFVDTIGNGDGWRQNENWQKFFAWLNEGVTVKSGGRHRLEEGYYNPGYRGPAIPLLLVEGDSKRKLILLPGSDPFDLEAVKPTSTSWADDLPPWK